MSEETGLKTKVAKGLMWGGLNNAAQQLLNLIIGIFLARILTPADYGMVGVLAVFSALAGALQEGGFISALNIRKNVSQLDYCSVFWFNIICGATLYTILFFCAPFIARFYDLPELTSLSRFIFLAFLFSSANISARAYMFRNLMVKETAFIGILSLILSGLIGVSLALSGFAYWGLAWQTVSYTFFITLFSFYFSRFRPSFIFSAKAIKEMLGYSFKLIITNVFNILNNNVFAVLLGKFYSPGDVGDFNQANKWTSMGYTLITGMIGSVSQPALARVAEDRERQTQVFRKLLRFTSFVSFPAMFGLALIAPDFIVITITEKWLFSAYILQVLCIWGAFYPLAYLFSNLILSQGRSNAYMWSTIILSCIQIVAVCLCYPLGLFCMLFIFVGINIVWLVVWYLLARQKISLTLINGLKDVLPFLLLALASIIPGYFISSFVANLWLSLLIKISVTAILYTGILWILGARILKESLMFLRRKTICNT